MSDMKTREKPPFLFSPSIGADKVLSTLTGDISAAERMAGYAYLVAVFLAYRGKSLLTVSLAASAAVMITEFLMKIVK